jgi:hypothetical protein
VRDDAIITPDRYLFLCALQADAPAFWHGLKKSTDYGTSVEHWAKHAGVVDHWLVQVLQATVRRWQEHPEHLGCQLIEGYEWFAYPKESPVVPFAPQFTDPYPHFSGTPLDPDLNTAQSIAERQAIRATQRIETPKEFAQRMRQQFNTALTEYKKYHRSLKLGVRKQRREHAEWTALAAFGQKADGSPISVVEIAERWPSLKDSEDSYATVYRAVRRFASDIGLTLPKTT